MWYDNDISYYSSIRIIIIIIAKTMNKGDYKGHISCLRYVVRHEQKLGGGKVQFKRVQRLHAPVILKSNTISHNKSRIHYLVRKNSKVLSIF